jgi:hypothetical protein
MRLDVGDRVRVRDKASIAKYVHGAVGTIVKIKTTIGQMKSINYLVEFDTPLVNPVSVLTHMHFFANDLE